MPATIKVVFDLSEGQWADLHDPNPPVVDPANPDKPAPLREDVEYLGADTTELLVGRRPGGMTDAPTSSVIIRANRQDGSVVLIETALSCFVEAARALNAIEALGAASLNKLHDIAHKPMPPQ